MVQLSRKGSQFIVKTYFESSNTTEVESFDELHPALNHVYFSEYKCFIMKEKMVYDKTDKSYILSEEKARQFKAAGWTLDSSLERQLADDKIFQISVWLNYKDRTLDWAY